MQGKQAQKKSDISHCFPEAIRQLPPFQCRFDAYQLAAEGCRVLFAVYPAGSDIEPHTHDTENWGVVTKGEMFLTVEGVEKSYKPGDWYHVPAHSEHAARCHCDTAQIEFWFDPQQP